MNFVRMASWFVISLMMVTAFFGPMSNAMAQVARATDSAVTMKPISINKATAEELQNVRGIGPALAERIISYREANGGFKSLDQLREVRGIGDSKFEKLKNQITL